MASAGGVSGGISGGGGEGGRTGNESERYGAAGVQRDRWFHGLHAPPPPAAAAAASPALPLGELDVYGTLRDLHVRLPARSLLLLYGDIRERMGRVLGGLSEEQLFCRFDATLNPMTWVVGHVAHFYENMVLRLLGAAATPSSSSAASTPLSVHPPLGTYCRWAGRRQLGRQAAADRG